MKKSIIFSLLLVNLCFGQNPEIKAELPTVIPPSPTVAALMKFEEIPVSNYTGIPDISIPLISSPTHSKDININLELKYHPASVAADQTASDVGLGWSLFAGGTISRTVRGLPDEIIEYPTSSSPAKIGIHHSNLNVHTNHYYYLNNNHLNEEKTDYVTNPVSPYVYNLLNKYIWEVSELRKFDTEHDLWQFNFMGNSGRFYIKKNELTNQLEVIPLDEYRIKINYNYTTNIYNNNPYAPDSFTVYDDKGYKFIFEIKESSFYKTATESNYDGTNFMVSTSNERDNITSFHLSKIFDNNDKLIVEFEYSLSGEYSECKISSTEVRNDFIYPAEYDLLVNEYNCNNEFIPKRLNTNTTFNNKVRKLKKINIINIGTINLKYEHSREDTNIALLNSAASLTEIKIVDVNNIPIKTLTFEYDYSTVKQKRMILKKINEISEGVNNNYSLEYYNQPFDGFFVNSDYWGYFNLVSNCVIIDPFRKYPTPEFSTRDLLRKIKYPTGGCSIFDFEANTYSYQGDNEIQNYFEDDQNIQQVNNSFHSFSNTNNSLFLGNLSNYKKIIFSPSIFYSSFSNPTRTFILMKKINNQWVNANFNLQCENYENCCIEFYPEQNVEYKINYSNLDIQYNGVETLSISYYSAINQIKKYLIGGGNRIKKISYFDVDVPYNYYDYPTGHFQNNPTKSKLFDYSLLNDSSKSSGSLVYVKPRYSMQKSFSIKTACSCLHQILENGFAYNSISTENFYPGTRTNGSEIGYKNVKVWETGLGEKIYSFTSPIDYPEQIIVDTLFPHIASKNIDYKRGLLLSETIKNNNLDKINSISYTYEFIEKEEQTGLKFFKSYQDINFSGNYNSISPSENNFESVKYRFENNDNYFREGGIVCSIGFLTSKIDFHNGDPIAQRNIHVRPVIEAYGWAKLTNKTTKNYFYPNSNSTPNIVESVETYAYNPINKKISESTVSNSRGETLITNYFYHTGNSIHSQNRISEIERVETYRGSEMLSKSQIIYNNNWGSNVSFLPQTIQSAKGTEGYENRINFLKYDEFGNPLEVKQEGGIYICYIWGYNQTQPIAKIENATYAQVQPHVANLQTLSNGNNEQNLITALNNLRTALPNAMITTYTYKPLIGISTVTDPKGDKQTYHYDSFNRLEFVKDALGNILSENLYHYRTQN